jgi:hypothetical protein
MIRKTIVYGCILAGFLMGTAQASNGAEEITLLTNIGNIKQVQLPNGTSVITLPNDTKVIKKPGDAPYCLVGCDIAEDCKGNKPAAPTGMRWTCDNEKGACIGKCQLTISNKKIS